MNSAQLEELKKFDCQFIEKLLPRIVVVPDDEGAICRLVAFAREKRYRICATGKGTSFPANYDASEDQIFLLMTQMNQLIDLRLLDATVEVEAGILTSDLAKRLNGTDFGFPAVLTEYKGTVGGALLGADKDGIRHLEIRRRLLGITLVDPLGRLLKFGGPTIKNVAGYDVWSFVVGTGGRFGVLTHCILNVEKLPPISAVAQKNITCGSAENPARWIYANLGKRLDPDGIFVR